MSASGGAGGLGGAGAVNVSAIEAKAAAADAKEVVANQETSEMSMITASQDLTNPAAATRTRKKEEKFESIENRKKASAGEEKKTKSTEEKAGEDLADKTAANNPEISAKDLRSLKDSISDDASPEDILKMVNEKFSDPVSKMQALEYLDVTTPASQGALKEAVSRARQQFFSENQREVSGGKNILFASQQYAESLNVSPAGLRSLYTEVTGDTHSCQQLLGMLQDRYTFPEMGKVTSFLLNGMSADMKSSGPSIDPAKLQVMMNEIKNLQAVVTSFDFFETSFPVMESSLKMEGIPLPSDLNFVKVAEGFHRTIGEKFPSMAKLQNEVQSLVGTSVEAQSAVLNLFFRGLSKTSPRLYTTAEKRDQLAAVITNTLDSINANNDDYPKPTDFPKPKPWS
ncbi:type III secretion system gatekeeper subunit SctW [Chlamydiifrater phoenicopteri]|uniref:type III secretion system gatekeeper subunit SctW n=1 Tax=Chlamydiifrater phoenicopteri TaxID=2681469 RepID=UPI001BCF7A89|nr:type III secretion system gatekeeper subunit SctW [Chlamydiifrater phoenicopteri]